MAVIDFNEQLEAANHLMRDGACKGLTHLFFPSAAERPQARERRGAGAPGASGSGCVVQVGAGADGP